MQVIIKKQNSNRTPDLEHLNERFSNGNYAERRRASKAIEKIESESSDVRDMRKKLVQAHREGNVKQIERINSIVERNKHYRNGE